MVKESYKYPLIEAAIKRSPLPRLWTITIVAVVLLLLLILMAYFDGILTTLFEWSELRYLLFS
jgi:ABC-type transporter Mla maintaining outer membrane lipid asymmetry permease subunit MlaE